MIRPATVSDIPRLLEMGERFAKLARLEDHVGYNPNDMAVTFTAMIEKPECCIFIGEAGAIGGLVTPHPFNHSRMVADELFWWSEDREGLALLDTFERWANGFGAIMRMTALEAVQPERVASILKRRGYSPLERSFVRAN